ncbi:MAG: M13 family peptidase [Bacteroidetes bacterium]|nr:M13 family peptidase [Bacteroidota bacterium]
MNQTEKKAIDTTNMNLTVEPGDNFYEYATGGWQEKNPLTAEYSRYGSFDVLQEENNKKVRSLIEDLASGKYPENELAQKIGNLYAQGMDSGKIEKQFNEPISPILEQINAITGKQEILHQIIDFHKKGVFPLFYLSGTPDRKNSDWVIISLYQGGLGMNDRDYYIDEDQRSKEIQEAYRKYAATLFELSGDNPDSAQKNAQIVYDFEKQLAENSMNRLQRRDPKLTYNKMDLAGLTYLSSDFNWAHYFNKVNVSATEQINVAQPDFFKYVSKAFENHDLETWKTYLKWNLLNDAAPYLAEDYVNARFEFYGKVMQGKEQIRPRWKRMVSLVNNGVGEALGKVYVEKYFPPEAKQRMLDLVENLRISFENRIQELDWMSDTTKTEALAKLERIRVKIGYPDKWRDFSALELNSEYLYHNVLEANIFNTRYEWDKIGKPVDKDEWLMLPHTVNAYYHPLHNEIVFPAGILQPPFFYQTQDDAVNYGAIGVVIGHEMTHGFDDKGRQYDKEGNLNDWWTQTDAERFDNKSKVLVDQYNQFTVLDTIMANGELTLGENIADLGGLQISLDAFEMTDQYKENTTVDGFTPVQRFFISYANVWAQNIRDEEKLRRVKEDVHSLGEHRVNGPLPNISEFYIAFEVDSNDSLYIEPEKRATIW